MGHEISTEHRCYWDLKCAVDCAASFSPDTVSQLHPDLRLSIFPCFEKSNLNARGVKDHKRKIVAKMPQQIKPKLVSGGLPTRTH